MSKTIKREDCKPRTLAMAEAIQDIIKLEELWFVIQQFLEEERAEAIGDCMTIIEDDPTSENIA